MQNVTFIFIGGFLGAGKTTLLAQTARRLTQRGKRVGLVTNDQADDLVDTGLLKRNGLAVQEVAGGCFCCRFDDLVNAAETLLDELKPDVLLGEPVGSCTDISATVLQPCKQLYGDWFRVAPFTVLADPKRLREALDPDVPASLPPNVTYIFEKQLEEADIIVLNKVDLVSDADLTELQDLVRRHLPDASLMTMFALEGRGVEEWLDRVTHADGAGSRIAEVDYDRYADGEAVLGWLNATVQLDAAEPPDWTAFCRQLLAGLQSRFAAGAAEIAHLKLLLSVRGGALSANVTSTGESPRIQGAISAPATQAALILNARVHQDPESLRRTIEDALSEAADNASPALTADIAHLQSLSPGRPEPVHRFDTVV